MVADVLEVRLETGLVSLGNGGGLSGNGGKKVNGEVGFGGGGKGGGGGHCKGAGGGKGISSGNGISNSIMMVQHSHSCIHRIWKAKIKKSLVIQAILSRNYMGFTRSYKKGRAVLHYVSNRIFWWGKFSAKVMGNQGGGAFHPKKKSKTERI